MSDQMVANKNDANQSPILVYDYNLNFHTLRTFDLTSDHSRVTRSQYRFIKRDPLLKHNIIEVHEHANLSISYTAISHTWYGTIKKKDKTSNDIFSKVGNKYEISGPPIRLEILKHACRAAEKEDTDWIWLDRLCINTTDKVDHSWQMMQMHEIYQKSKLCVVFPNGLEQLTGLNEQTGWIDRGWTLQEAVAPSSVQVMFEWQWPSDKNKIDLPHNSDGIVKIADECAMAPLSALLDWTIEGQLNLANFKPEPVSIFGTTPKVTSPNATDKHDHRLVLPNVAALAVILKKRPEKSEQLEIEKYVYHHCLWKSTMMRSTRDPADMIFSIMGLFGNECTLDPNAYKNKYDCIKPAIHLAQKILNSNNDAASWLGVSCFSPPCPELSTFPSFPRVRGEDSIPTVAIPGRGRVQASQLMLNEYLDTVPNDLLRISKATMDDEGYLTFTGMSVPVCEIADFTQAEGSDPSIWLPAFDYKSDKRVVWYKPITNPDQNKPCSFAILLGAFKSYRPQSSRDIIEDAHSNLRGFIVSEEVGPSDKKRALQSYFLLNSNNGTSDWIKSWKTRTFCVGGPPSLLINDYVKNELNAFEATVLADSKFKAESEAESEVESEVDSKGRPKDGKGRPKAESEDKYGDEFEDESKSKSKPPTTRGKIKSNFTPQPVFGRFFDPGYKGSVNHSVLRSSGPWLGVPPEARYKVHVVGGNPWESHGLWTHDKLSKLRDLVAENNKK